MTTKGTGQFYDHRWVEVPNAAVKMDFGWYYLFAHRCRSEDYQK